MEQNRETAMEIARQSGHAEIARFLKDAMGARRGETQNKVSKCTSFAIWEPS
jgi:hypothetical protein